MRKIIAAIVFLMLTGPEARAQQAKGNCQAAITTAEDRLGSYSGREKQKSPGVEKASILLEKAKDAQTSGKFKKCTNMAKKALELLK